MLSGAFLNLKERKAKELTLTQKGTSSSLYKQIGSMDEYVVVNVRGMEFHIRRNNLRRAPNSLLAENYISGKDPNRKYYYRNPFVFQSIADYYETGRLHFHSSYCLPQIRMEMEYWKLDVQLLSNCCWDNYCSRFETHNRVENIKKKYEEKGEKDVKTSNERIECTRVDGNIGENDIQCAGKVRNRLTSLWNFLDKPNTSKPSKIFALCIIGLVLISILNLMLQSIQSCRNIPPHVLAYMENNLTEGKNCYILRNSEPHPILRWLDNLTGFVFTLELLLRLIACPDKFKFLKNPFTITDAIAILPMWILLFISIYGGDELKSSKLAVVLSITRLFRIFRLVRLGKHVPALKLIVMAGKSSYKELLLMFILLSVFGMLFSFLMYYSEIMEDNYNSIFEGFWWALVTMTTVGYGDYYPVGPLGKVVGAICAVSGILVIALPVPIIVNNFGELYAATNIVQNELARPEVEVDAQQNDVTIPGVSGSLDIDVSTTPG